jgi:hypothetical protein
MSDDITELNEANVNRTETNRYSQCYNLHPMQLGHTLIPISHMMQSAHLHESNGDFNFLDNQCEGGFEEHNIRASSYL